MKHSVGVLTLAWIALAEVALLLFLDGSENSVAFISLALVILLVFLWLSFRGVRSILPGGCHSITPGTGFLLVAITHAILGYLSAAFIFKYLIPVNNGDPAFLGVAFRLYFIGICAASATYTLSVQRQSRFVRNWRLVTKLVDSLAALRPGKLTTAASFFISIGALLCFWVFYKIGFTPLLAENPITARYFGLEVSANYLFYQEVLRRALILIGVSVPIVLLAWLERRRSLTLIFFGILGLSAAVASTRRGALIVIILSVLLVRALQKQRLTSLIVAGLIVMLVLLGFQYFFMGANQAAQTLALNAIATYGSLFSEVDDLAWVMAYWDGKPLWGATFVAAVLPVPASHNEFKNDFVLSNVTKNIVGFTEDSPTGGLRISIFGESFLNFGLVGVLAAGLLFGEILARIDQIYVALRRRMELSRVNSLMLYPFVFLYILVVYQLYLSGSGVVADGVLSTLILGIMYSVGRHRSIAPAGASSPSSLTKLRPGW